jgi:hypothetical protein
VGVVSEPVSMLEFLRLQASDPGVGAEFAVDPEGTLLAFGLGDLSPRDVYDSIHLAQDNRIVDFGEGMTGLGLGESDLGNGVPHPDGASDFAPVDEWDVAADPAPTGYLFDF